jgi:hypothetical protein
VKGKNGLEEGFLLIDVKGGKFDWHYLDYRWNKEGE